MASTLVLFAAVFSVVATGAYSVPGTILDQLFEKRQVSMGVQCRGNPSAEVLQCIQPLEALAHPSSGFLLDSVDTLEALDIACQELNNAKDCVADVHANCGQEDMVTGLILETMDGVVGYMCSDQGRELLLSEADCWENDNLKSGIESCTQDARIRVGNDPCSILRGIRTCARETTEEVCNSNAARFVDNMFYYTMEPMVTRMTDCEIHLRISRSIMNLLPLRRK